jgi:hypothetical protein
VNAPRGAVLAAAAFWLAGSAASVRAAEATMTLDLDGDGSAESVRARGTGRKVELTVTNAAGKRVSRVRVPSPAAGVEILALAEGELGSAGALIEVEATGASETCRSIWRLRESRLDAVPLREGAATVPDCEAGGWSATWEIPEGSATSIYRRSRSRDAGGQRHEETRVYAFTGFALERDAARGSATIDGVEIPRWPLSEMLPTDAVDRLREAFDYETVRTAPRLFLDTDRDAGVFRVRMRDGEGEIALAVRASSRPESGLQRLEASDGQASGSVAILVRDGLPTEATVTGMGDRFDRVYRAVSRLHPDRIVLYPNPEEDVAREILPGSWSGRSGGRIEIRLAAEGPGRVEMDGKSYRVAIRGAPSGTDVLLLPIEASGQTWALDLRTVDGLIRVPARCAATSSEDPRCEVQGTPSELYRRVGARLNR